MWRRREPTRLWAPLVQAVGPEIAQAFVLEVEVHEALAAHAALEFLRQGLPEKRRLAGPARTDDRLGLSRHAGNADVTAGRGRRVGGQGIDDFLSDDVAHVSFSGGRLGPQASVLEGYMVRFASASGPGALWQPLTS